tara:strand:- start:53 stop:445 length:393 start_codon:yes stop_codon:yes gene_type:complete
MVEHVLENILFVIFVIGIFGGTFYLAKKRGRNPWRWLLACLFLNFIALIILLCLSPVQTSDADNSRSDGLKGGEFYKVLKELPGVGEKTAWAVLNVYPDSNNLIGVTIDQLKRIDGVSHANAEAIKHHFG